MISSILSIVSGANEIHSLQSWLSGVVTKNRGPKRAILAEISVNFKIMKVLLRSDVNVAEIISTLRTQAFDQLESSNFSFNVLKRQKVSFKKLGIKSLPSLAFIDNTSTEDLICRTYERIRVLQGLAKTASKNARVRDGVRFDVRLQNIAKLLLILVLHLKS
jgi:hypothetical protein